jgi:ABC-2 type transport system ATP-binding protein
MTNPAIAARGLRKSYGDKAVLDGIDLSVAEGTVFSLLGPNGAGKTTTVQILSTLIGADGGEIRVAGHDPATDPQAVRASIGVTGQYSAVDRFLTGEENLQLMADLHHLPRRESRQLTARLLERFDLVEAGEKVTSTYSGGMRRRLDLAMTLVGNPRIIFLSSSWTSPPPAWTRAAAAPCGRSSATSWKAASRSFSPPRTWRRPTSSPTASRCSTTAC